MKHCFLINPAAGKGTLQNALEHKIRQAAESRGLDYQIHRTTGTGEATLYVRRVCADGMPVRFYACGGDGTLQETVVGALGAPHTQITVIPCGSGNDFVRSFENPEQFSSIECQLDGVPYPCDLLRVNDRYAVNLCNVGFDADIAYDMNKFKNLPFISGSTAYNLALVYNLLKPLGKRVSVQLDTHTPATVNTLLVAAANGRFYGGGYQAAPLARMDDGILDVCRVDKLSRFRIAGFVRFYKRGEHLQTSGIQDVIHYDKCKSVRIQSVRPYRYILDGESYLSNDVTVELLPKAFTLSIPKGCLTRQADEKTVAVPIGT